MRVISISLGCLGRTPTLQRSMFVLRQVLARVLTRSYYASLSLPFLLLSRNMKMRRSTSRSERSRISRLIALENRNVRVALLLACISTSPLCVFLRTLHTQHTHTHYIYI